MITKEIIKSVLDDFKINNIPICKPRKAKIPLNTGQVISIIGARRSGKTYLLYDLMNKLILKGKNKSNFIYLNFEDERLSEFTINDFDLILQSIREKNTKINLNNCYFFFDEIQNISGWEKFVRRLHDSVSKNIFLTGSNSKLLSSEIATSLRGRTIVVEVFPLIFEEYLNFKNIKIDTINSLSRAKIINSLNDFLKYGSFPDVINQKKQVKLLMLQEYFNTMIYRDIVERYNISNPLNLKFFIKYLINNNTSEFSVNKIYNNMKSLGLKTGKELLYVYIEYIENIYLANILKKFDYSFRNQESSDRKLYAIDNGIYTSLNKSTTPNVGKLLECSVYNFLLIKYGKENVFYYKDRYECDFLIIENNKILDLIQVTYKMSDSMTRERELNGLIKACQALNYNKGKIITLDDNEEKIIQSKITIHSIPAWKFFLT
jgi:uncharacterized protein